MGTGGASAAVDGGVDVAHGRQLSSHLTWNEKILGFQKNSDMELQWAVLQSILV